MQCLVYFNDLMVVCWSYNRSLYLQTGGCGTYVLSTWVSWNKNKAWCSLHLHPKGQSVTSSYNT